MSGANGHDIDAEGEQGPAPTWRHLSFYEASRVRDAVDFASSPSAFRSSNEIAAVSHSSTWPSFVQQQQAANEQSNGSTSASPSSSRQECVLIGDISGRVRVLDAERYTEVGSWQAFYGSEGTTLNTGRVTHLSCDGRGRVVTLGEDDGARFPVIRIWDLTKTAKTGNDINPSSPRLISEGKVQHGSRPHPIAALAHTPSLSFLSIGLADGSVLLLRGLDEVLKSASNNAEAISSSVPAVTLPKFKVAFQPAAVKLESASTIHEAVTGLGFAEHAPSQVTAESGKVKESKALPATTGRNGIDRSRKSLANAGLSRARQSREDHRRPPDTVNLFIVTLTRILRYTVLGKGAGSPASVVDDVGCALGCARLVPLGRGTSSPMEGKMVIARDEAIYVVGADGREMSLAYEGPKASICLAATQLVIVSPPIMASSASDSATVRQYINDRNRLGRTAGRSESSPRRTPGPIEVAKVTIFDLDNKLIAYSGTFEGGVKEVWSGSQGDVCVLGHDGNLTRLEEKTLRQKLDVVIRKSLYLLAVNVAKSHASRSVSTVHEVDSIDPLLADIYRKYGDALYEKGDFEGAVNQFVRTIGYTQPSYVIRKFLDAQRTTNLTTYLQELHACGVANSDHTTLLLNCYTKLKDVVSLDRFIKRPLDAPGTGEKQSNGGQASDEDLDGVEEELPFDLDTAVRVCRQAGYFEHAAYLAKRYGQHDEYIRIQIEDRKDFVNALSHIRGLSAEEAERNLLRYGKAMLNQLPAETTGLLIEICSGAFQPMPVAVGAGVEASKAKSAAATYLTSLQFGPFGKAASSAAVQGDNERSSTPSIIAPSSDPIEAEGGKAQPAASSYTVPSPRIFFAHFIKHPSEFETFLETVALARWGQSVDVDKQEQFDVAEASFNDDEAANEYSIDSDKQEQMSIWNTLLELYLTSARASNQSAGYAGPLDGAQRSAKKRKALQLLRQYKTLPYDTSQALTVCSQEDFISGIVYLYERMGMYEDILYLYMEQEEQQQETDSSTIIDCLARYGGYEPQLYPILLRYLASSERLLSRHHNDLETILQHIEDERLMSPLEVVQTLSKKGVASVGLIRSFLIRSINSQKADMETNSKLTSTYRKETDQKLLEIESLKDLQHPKIFQQTKCNACSGTLDLPIVHFMCKHSFHARCLGEEETECPICAKSHGVILEIRKNNLTFGDRQDLFLNEVEEAEDGFDVVASMFSKGLFGQQQLGADNKV